MPFLGFGNSPYMLWSKKLKDFDRNLLNQVAYQVTPSPNGVPMVQLDLAFNRLDANGNPVRDRWGQAQNYLVNMNWAKNFANPDMSVVVLMDISGSMIDTWREGHTRDVCKTILNYTLSAGQGYDLICYNDYPTDCGAVSGMAHLGTIITNNRPHGGTSVTEALQLACTKYKKRKGLYIIVITDGEFSDKVQVRQFLNSEIIPKLTPDNPYAYRLHFVGAGEGVDHAFLNQLEQLATGQGVRMVASNHHAHLSHSHGNILDELDSAFISRTEQFTIYDASAPTTDPIVTRIGEPSAGWIEGPQASFPFIPARSKIGLEFMPHHPAAVPVRVDLKGNFYEGQEIYFNVPLPRATAAGANKSVTSNWTDLFKLPLLGTPEERQAAEKRKQYAEEVHEAELIRQSIDLKELTSGGLPVQAKERLKELANNQDSLFTSDLAPDELALLRRCGFSPRGLVTGSAMYHVGQSYASTTRGCEVQVLSKAYNEAFALAVSRMKKELALIGAHGVVGVRLSIVRHEWSEHVIEVQAIGTAVEGPPGYASKPWTSDLSGQEWYALWQAGYEPADLVWGHCSWFVLTTQQDEMLEKGSLWGQFGNQEMEQWSTALHFARDNAMQRVRKQTMDVKACGVVGVHVSRKLSEVRLKGEGEDPAYEREHHNLLVSIVGTAIRVRANAPAKSQGATYAISLRDGRLKPLVVKQLADLKIE